jgi:hypothetical protein
LPRSEELFRPGSGFWNRRDRLPAPPPSDQLLQGANALAYRRYIDDLRSISNIWIDTVAGASSAQDLRGADRVAVVNCILMTTDLAT